ncbi:MAG: hypothetical protein SWZ49_05585 [Cyanobacteriota bacterium]|nr:hypothetical protein [Cyanobacteriota bacterium]
MTTQPDYSKIYTHAPEQHPNLILGSLQLLFWMFFRPAAFKNHLKSIHPVLETNTSLITVLRIENHLLKNPALWKFILQGFVILPVLSTVVARAIVILFLVALGMPLQQAISVFLLDLFYRVAVGMALSVPIGVAYGVPFGVAEGMAGSLFFADIQNNQVDATGLEILEFIAAKGEEAIVNQKTLALEFQEKNYHSAIVLLKQRELIEEVEDGYKFQVELIRCWFENNN